MKNSTVIFMAVLVFLIANSIRVDLQLRSSRKETLKELEYETHLQGRLLKTLDDEELALRIVLEQQKLLNKDRSEITQAEIDTINTHLHKLKYSRN